MDNTCKLLMQLSKDVYENYENFNKEKLIKSIEKEKLVYKSINVFDLGNIFRYFVDFEKKINNDELDNYELILYQEKEELFVRRIINNIEIFYHNEPVYEEFSKKRLYKNNEIIELNENMIFLSHFCEDAIMELCNKLYSNVDAKFIYLLKEYNLDLNNQFIHKMSFINPYVEEKLINNNFVIDDSIKEEDILYNNLWDGLKTPYNEELEEYCINNITKTIVIMLSKIDNNSDYNTKVRAIFLRTLLNYLDENTVLKLYNSYINKKCEVYNINGEYEINKSFIQINDDKKIIQKIKAR